VFVFVLLVEKKQDMEADQDDDVNLLQVFACECDEEREVDVVHCLVAQGGKAREKGLFVRRVDASLAGFRRARILRPEWAWVLAMTQMARAGQWIRDGSSYVMVNWARIQPERKYTMSTLLLLVCLCLRQEGHPSWMEWFAPDMQYAQLTNTRLTREPPKLSRKLRLPRPVHHRLVPILDVERTVLDSLRDDCDVNDRVWKTIRLAPVIESAITAVYVEDLEAYTLVAHVPWLRALPLDPSIALAHLSSRAAELAEQPFGSTAPFLDEFLDSESENDSVEHDA
jgi:hypothetical protein